MDSHNCFTEGGFAASGFADNAYNLALTDGHRDIIQGFQPADTALPSVIDRKPFRKTVYLKDGLVVRPLVNRLAGHLLFPLLAMAVVSGLKQRNIWPSAGQNTSGLSALQAGSANGQRG